MAVPEIRNVKPDETGSVGPTIVSLGTRSSGLLVLHSVTYSGLDTKEVRGITSARGNTNGPSTLLLESAFWNQG